MSSIFFHSNFRQETEIAILKEKYDGQVDYRFLKEKNFSCFQNSCLSLKYLFYNQNKNAKHYSILNEMKKLKIGRLLRWVMAPEPG